MLLEQFQTFWKRDTGIPRSQLAEVQRAVNLPHAVIISGLRRVEKSTLLAQMAHILGQENFYYLNFEDDRFLGFQTEDMNYLYQVLVELFGDRKIFILDEVQNILGWEHFVRRFMETGFKFYITGSNASLLSRELGTRLTGRYVAVELFPFSFQEFLRFRGDSLPDLRRMTTTDRGMLDQSLQAYLVGGGIPVEEKMGFLILAYERRFEFIYVHFWAAIGDLKQPVLYIDYCYHPRIGGLQ